ncbi:hypothetical protein KIV56_04510 [Cryobacterium breve]|uniref:Uncharacterized protein n=1 Tax=Cryobacterium breve TaxID=1259258 RepID=A0ABY7NEF8_9MICO|nr:hypothetical protein [Cryobacterium breve]WBM80665.1 hypothetical protein KIV56_04510 [Cryobacterium breve]
MDELTSTSTPGIYTATGAGTIAIVEIAGPHALVAWLLREVSDDDDDQDSESEWPGGPINDLSLTIGAPGILHGVGNVGDTELGIVRTITKLRPRVP